MFFKRAAIHGESFVGVCVCGCANVLCMCVCVGCHCVCVRGIFMTWPENEIGLCKKNGKSPRSESVETMSQQQQQHQQQT